MREHDKLLLARTLGLDLISITSSTHISGTMSGSCDSSFGSSLSGAIFSFHSLWAIFLLCTILLRLSFIRLGWLSIWCPLLVHLEIEAIEVIQGAHLPPHQAPVVPLLRQEFLWSSMLNNHSVSHADNLMSMSNGTQAMRDDQRGATNHDCIQGILHSTFCLCVESTRCLIKDKNLWFQNHCSGYAQSLLLSSRYVGALITDVGVIPCWEAHDEIMRCGQRCCSLDLLIGHLPAAAIGEIVANACVKEQGLLSNQCHARVQLHGVPVF
mmetsp:Transcript_64354/g.114440  ORF Transcript_64354/g.114440 Transcript_64354/m.114440 type:complete len:268 (-) Transcript_64354:672-1475(-)